MKSKPSQTMSHLRGEAEARLSSGTPEASPARTHKENRHELQVHQIELEMQNETLRQTQVVLENSRDRYAELYEFAPSGYFTLSREGTILAANLTAVRMLGMERRTLLNRRFDLFVTETWRDEWLRLFMRSLAEAGEQIGELELQCTDDSPRLMHVHCRRMEASDEATTLQLALTDITQRKRIEQALSNSELRLQLALDATGDGLWDWDLRSDQTYLSPSYYALTGYRPEEVTPDFAFFQRLVHPDDLHGVLSILEPHLRGETPVSDVEYRMITAAGTIRWMRGRGRVVERDARGAPLRMVGHITDISARKHMEQALKESEARYRAVVESQTEVIARVRADGTILFVNEVYCRLFGKTAQELIRNKWQPVAHPDDLAMIEARLVELTPDNPVVVIENRVFDGHGEMRWMQFINHAFFDTAGCLMEIQAVGRDISKRKQIEAHQAALLEENTLLGRKLIQLQEKERASLARELHDELSQQLVAIRVYAGAIRHRATGADERFRKDAMAIEASVSQIYTVSHQIMEGLHPQALDTAGLAEAVRALLSSWSQLHPAIRVTLRLAGPLDDIGEEARIHLYRIVQEGLANLARHARAGRARLFLGETARAGRRTVRLVLRDDGVGMDLAAPRAGFGLIVMRERARNLGGSFELCSRPGGTRISVMVPLPA